MQGVELHYETFNLGFLKYFPLLKLLYISLYLLVKYKKILRRADFIYSHTLWTNGLLAYFSNKLFGVNYIVAARSNDYHTFLKYLPQYRFVIRAIVNNSIKVVFISDVYKNLFLKKYTNTFSGVSTTVIYNGIDDFWLIKSKLPLRKKPQKPEVLFVGRFNKTKNIPLVIRTIFKVRELYPEVTLRIAGGSESELLSLINYKQLPNWIHIEGQVDKEKLYKLYSNSKCLFVPSIQETFGLVYIEALSSGCPVIHSVNEAIDGIYSNNINVVAVDPSDVLQMTEAVIKCLSSSFEFDRESIFNTFGWDSFSVEVIKIFHENLKSKS